MKSILVHLDASARSAERLGIALDLAHRHEAELTGLYAVLPTLPAIPLAGGAAAASGAAAAAYDFLERLDRERRVRARAMFERDCAGRPATWAELSGELFDASLRRHALLADLLVLGQYDGDDASAGALPSGYLATLLVGSGRPALVIPKVGQYERIGERALLAWKPTREARHAMAAALPWLRGARSVHVACDAETAGEPLVGTVALERWLRLNGVTAPVTVGGLPARDIGDALLSMAANTGADLLVMGCYGHSRAREWVLGGATRTVLGTMTLPVLMAH